MTLRSVACAWCGEELRVATPEVGGDAYFLLPRRCRSCAGNNSVEVSGAVAHVAKIVRKRLRPQSLDTAKVTQLDGLQRRGGVTR